jgi:RimJ/RimL family protein N-acetyltransferase
MGRLGSTIFLLAVFDFSDGLPRLEGPRVLLRQLEARDLSDLLAVFGDPYVAKYWGGELLGSLEEAQQLLAQITTGIEQRQFFQWAIALKPEDSVVGTCTLFALNQRHRRAELGFALKRSHWGRGLGTEAVRVLVAFAFGRMGLHRLEADTDPRNDASRKLLSRLGFREEGYLRERYFTMAEVQDAVFFGLLRSEWLAANEQSQ